MKTFFFKIYLLLGLFLVLYFIIDNNIKNKQNKLIIEKYNQNIDLQRNYLLKTIFNK